jgi:hypothetical protein
MKTKITVLALVIIGILIGRVNFAISADPVNIANQCLTSADATASGYALNSAIDGNLLTLWSAGSNGTQSNPHWWKCDLQGNWQVSQITVNMQPWSGSLYRGYTNVYNLYISNDGNIWNLIGSGTIAEETDPAAYSDTYTLSTGTSIRYIKYEVVGGSHWADLGEIEIKALPKCELIDAVKPHTFTSGTPAKASEVNADFDTIYTQHNNLNCQVQDLKAQILSLKAIICQDHPTLDMCK